MSDIYRHGDLLAEEVSAIPADAIETPSQTLAEGEVTGHHHTFVSGDVLVFNAPANSGEGVVKYFQIKSKEATLTHQEHGPMTMPQGTYALSIEREYNPTDKVVRQVLD
jgi:hypothetical protein